MAALSKPDNAPAHGKPGEAGRSGALLNRVGAAAVIPDLLRDLGVDPAEVFAAAALDRDAFKDPEAAVTVEDLGRLASACLRASGQPHFGLLVADRAGADRTGLLGGLFLTADDLRAALHDLVRYFHLATRGGVAVLNLAETVAEIRIGLAGPYGDAGVVFEDSVLGILFLVIRRYLGAGWRPTEVLLPHAPNPHSGAYRQFFGAPVRFDSLYAAISFPASDLNRHNFAREAERRRLETAATLASAKLAIGIDEEVRWAILGRLGPANPTIDTIAEALGLSRRTLNRRLADRGATFAQLLRAVRFARARQLLVESDTPLADIATAVGYSEPSVFSNAFRLWSGVSPREWRRLHGRR